MSPSSQTVSNGDWIILKLKGDGGYMPYFKAIQIKNGTTINLGKKLGQIPASSLINLEFDFYYEIVTAAGKTQIIQCPSTDDPLCADFLAAEGTNVCSSANNLEIVDDNSAQSLTHDEVVALKNSVSSSEEIVSALIKGSRSFEKKTEFSQQKYLKKKHVKYSKTFKLLNCSFENLYWNFWCKAPQKILSIRLDTLSQLLNLSNVQAGSNVLAVDDTHGLISLALLQRMKDADAIQSPFVTLVESVHPDLLHYGANDAQQFVHTSLDRLTQAADPSADLEACEAVDGVTAAKRTKIDKARTLFRESQFDVLICASQSIETSSLLVALKSALKPSRQAIFYAFHKESLLEAYKLMRQSGEFVNVQLTESFLREYQTLPGRMHPMMKTSGSGGYLLYGTKILAA